MLLSFSEEIPLDFKKSSALFLSEIKFSLWCPYSVLWLIIDILNPLLKARSRNR